MRDKTKKNLITLLELIGIALIAYGLLTTYNNLNYHSETRAFDDNARGLRCAYYLEYQGSNLIGITLLDCITLGDNF